MEITPAVKDDFVVFEDTMTVSQVIGKLKQFEKRTGLVFRHNKYLGLIEKKKLLQTKLDTKKTKITNIIERTPVVDQHADIIETAYLMCQSNLDFLPVKGDTEIIGVVSGVDVAKLAVELPEVHELKVSDLKLVKDAKVNKDAPLASAISIMYQQRVDQVPVLDKGKLYGIISYRDLLRRYLNWSRKRDVSAHFNKIARTKSAEVDMPKLASLPVSSFSTNENLVSVQNSSSLPEAVALMAKKRLSALLVLAGSELQGLLTVKNILRAVGSLKIQPNYNIKFVGLNKLHWQPYEKQALQKIAANESFKLQRQIRNEFMITLHLKEYEKTGRRQKFAVNIRLEYPGKMLSVSQEDWEWRTAVRKTFHNARNAIRKRFKEK